MKDQVIAGWFSCGAASAVAAKLLVDKYGGGNSVLLVNNPVAEENKDNLRFLKDCEKWIGQEIIFARNEDLESDSAVDIWNKRKYMAGTDGAPCTMLLKREARYQFEKKHKIDWHVLGFTLEEKHRHDKFVKVERDNVIPILIEEGISKDDCYKIIEDAGILLPLSYRQGFPNANCEGCVKASSATYWNHTRRINPEVFEARAEQSRRIGAKLVRWKGERMFLDELPKDAVGRKMKSWDCGIFCITD